MNTLLGILVVASLVGAFVLLVISMQQRKQTGVPFSARIVYADTGAWQKIEQPLFSRRHQLAGKPDYIVDVNGATIPIEVKPTRTAPTPRESDVMQLAAYSLLIEENFGTMPPHGLLKYRDAVFQIDFTDELRARLHALLNAMRADATPRQVDRSHAEPARCRACGFRAECKQVLDEKQ